MPDWNQRQVLERLKIIETSLPQPVEGVVTDEILGGMISYARDMEIFHACCHRVLVACCTSRPHPEFGDDGYQEEMRLDAIKALDWTERWMAVRTSEQWGSGRGYSWLGHLPEYDGMETVTTRGRRA